MALLSLKYTGDNQNLIWYVFWEFFNFDRVHLSNIYVDTNAPYTIEILTKADTEILGELHKNFALHRRDFSDQFYPQKNASKLKKLATINYGQLSLLAHPDFEIILNSYYQIRGKDAIVKIPTRRFNRKRFIRYTIAVSVAIIAVVGISQLDIADERRPQKQNKKPSISPVKSPTPLPLNLKIAVVDSLDNVAGDIDINARNIRGETALMMACKDDNYAAVEALLARGAQHGLADKKGNTALHIAAGHARLSIIGMLIDKGSGINVQNQEQESPLMRATKAGSVGGVEYLLARGADPYLADVNKKTPLAIALANENLELYKLLAD